MDKIKIIGGYPLKGTVKIQGAKNAALPILISTILFNEEVTIGNIPQLEDITTTLAILKELNLEITSKNANTFTFNSVNVNNFQASYDLVSTMRASMLILGPLLAKYKQAIVPLPGGCSIGQRPIDLHIKALRQMGAKITIEHGNIIASAKNGLLGTEINFDKVSVGATEHIIMAAVLANGKTIIHNAACEPEIVDLANFLNKGGAKITGQGTSTIKITGVEFLGNTNYTIMPDRIEAGSYALAAIATKGEVILENVKQDIFGDFLTILEKIGAKLKWLNATLLQVTAPKEIIAVDIITAPFPAFPTDLQSPFMSTMLCAKGDSTIKEEIFENRFTHVPELARMGAEIIIQDPHSVLVKGKSYLTSANVKATDLRAAFALIIAGLVAEGETVVTKLHHLDRGYEDVVGKLSNLKAKITRGK